MLNNSMRTFIALAMFALLSAEEKSVTGFTLILDGGMATYRLADHTLFFHEGERTEESMKLSDEQIARTLMLLSCNPALKATYAKKPEEKLFMEIHVVRDGGATEDRYLTKANIDSLNKDYEEKMKTSGDDPKILEQLDNQSELFPYLFSLTTASKPPRR